MKKNKIHNKFVLSCIIFIILISINLVTSAKYVFEYNFTVAKVNIDLTKPNIELLEIQNTNKGYEKYANNTHLITIKIKIIEDDIDTKNILDPQKIEINVDEIKQEPEISVNEVKRSNNEIYYDILLKNIKGNGNLTVIIQEGAITNNKNRKNDEKIIDTQITIDNIAPIALFREEIIENEKVEAVINTLETIRNIDGWNIFNNTELRKIFDYNIAFKLELFDYAQNSVNVQIVITQAKNIENKKSILNPEGLFN